MNSPPTGIFLVFSLAWTVTSIEDEPFRAKSERSFAIRVVDAATDRGIPLARLQTTDFARYWTDNAGLIAFNEPGLMGTSVFFAVASDGYDIEPDGFGMRGVRLIPQPGGEATIKLRRVNLAERLYRITGAGLYRDSLLLGRPTPLAHPAMNGLVMGQDSVVNARLDGIFYWFWGDTVRPSYPLGNFSVAGATSRLFADGGLDPDKGIDLEYFVDAEGFAKPMAPLAGPGPTWIFGVATVPGIDGRDHMLASYVKIRDGLKPYRHGAVEFDPKRSEWIESTTWPEGARNYPGGQTALVEEDGSHFVVFSHELPTLRIAADRDAYRDLDRYEAWTVLASGSTIERPVVDRDASGRVRLGWKRNAPVVTPDIQSKLVSDGDLRPEDVPIVLRDSETGRPIRPHGSSLAWNHYRSAWSLIVVERGGSSPLGEVWYAEADHPTGPWVYATKVVTHRRHSFYNPAQHPEFAKDGGRIIYFEGTYTQTFSAAPEPTPRHDYNQFLYRLDLSDSRLNLPRPAGIVDDHPGFYTPRRPGPGLAAFVRRDDGRLEIDESARPESVAGYLFPQNVKVAPYVTELILEYRDRDGRFRYDSKGHPEVEGRSATGRILGRAWPTPHPWATPKSVPR